MINYKRAGIDDGPPRVGLGSRVTLELVGEDGAVERLSLAVVTDDKADFPAGYLGAGTPLAAALLGQEAGRTVPYGRGGLTEVRILEVEPFAVSGAPDAAGARQAVIQEAIDKSDRTDMVRLALAVSVKWGDWDPSGISTDEVPLDK